MRHSSAIGLSFLCSLSLIAPPLTAEPPVEKGPPPALKEEQEREEKPDTRRRPGDERIADKLKVGDVAPDFTLKSLDGKETVRLSQFRDKQPVVLIFGSYT